MIEKSLALATALTPKMGYEEAARIAKNAYVQDKTIRQVVEGEGLFSKEELNLLLDPQSMITPTKRINKKKASLRVR